MSALFEFVSIVSTVGDELWHFSLDSSTLVVVETRVPKSWSPVLFSFEEKPFRCFGAMIQKYLPMAFARENFVLFLKKFVLL